MYTECLWLSWKDDFSRSGRFPKAEFSVGTDPVLVFCKSGLDATDTPLALFFALCWDLVPDFCARWASELYPSSLVHFFKKSYIQLCHSVPLIRKKLNLDIRKYSSRYKNMNMQIQYKNNHIGTHVQIKITHEGPKIFVLAIAI